MLHSFLQITLKSFLNHIFGLKILGFCHMRDVKASLYNLSKKSVN